MNLTILYVEDSKFVADAVKETLEDAGWRVETCADGFVALFLIKSERRYDLILLDNELPNLSGMELTRRTRELPHRKGMPIIMLSASECVRDALLAGADVFLRKPQDIGKIVETVARLLAARTGGSRKMFKR
ncbi:MAG TPA: response regulator [Pyrinomonadaceae bacterium]|jgi:DNA-binding response OmpR family regulator